MDALKVNFILNCMFKVYLFENIYMQYKIKDTNVIRKVLIYALYCVAFAIICLEKCHIIAYYALSAVIFILGLFSNEFNPKDRIRCAFMGVELAVPAYLMMLIVNIDSQKNSYGVLLFEILEITISFMLIHIGGFLKTVKNIRIYLFVIFYLSGMIYALRALFVQNQYFISVMICFLLLNILAIITIDSLVQLQTQKSMQNMLNTQIRYYENELKWLDRYNSKLRGTKHDLKNHLTVIKELIAGQENEKALDYIESIWSNIESAEIYITTGNQEFDAIINNKISMIKKNKINCSYRAVIPEQLNLNPVDCIIILGNIIDNAVTAVIKAKENNNITQNDEIDISIDYSRGILSVKVTNICIDDGREYYYSTAKHGRKIPEFLRTEKEDKNNHGIGIRNVISTVNKYSGEFEVNKIKGLFTVNIKICV